MLTLLALCSTLARAEDTTAAPAPVPAPTTEPAPAPTPVGEPAAAPAPAPTTPAPASAPVASPNAANQTLTLLEPEPRFEVGLETGWMAISDDRWGTFSSSEGRRTGGLRAAYRLNPSLAVVASWQMGANDAGVYGDEDVVYDEAYGYTDTTLVNGSFNAAFGSHELGLGARYGWEAFGSEIYLAGQAQFLLGKVTLDEDIDDDANPGVVEAKGSAIGAYAAVGISLPVELSDSLAVVPYLELGSSTYREASFGDLGGMQLGGGAGRFGVAARF